MNFKRGKIYKLEEYGNLLFKVCENKPMTLFSGNGFYVSFKEARFGKIEELEMLI